MPLVTDVELDVDNLSNDIYLKIIGNSIINLINYSFRKNNRGYNYDDYLKKALFQYLQTRYYGFMVDDYASHIIFSIDKYKKSYPNIFEILVDPALILKKYLFNNFLLFCRNNPNIVVISNNDIWIARAQFKKTLVKIYYYRAIGLNSLKDFPEILNPAAIRNNKKIEIPEIDIFEYFEKYNKFNSNYFFKSDNIERKINELFSRNKITSSAYKITELNTKIFTDNIRNQLSDILKSYFETIYLITQKSPFQETIYKYFLPISLMARFRISSSANLLELLLFLTGIKNSPFVDVFKTYFLFTEPRGKSELGKWVSNFITSNKLDPYNIGRHKSLKNLKLLDPLQSVSRYRQVSMSVVSNPEQSGGSYQFFKLYTLSLTALDHFTELEAKKLVLISENKENTNIPLSDELNREYTYNKLKDSLEDFVFGPIGKDMIAKSEIINYEKINPDEKFDLYTRVKKAKNYLLETNYSALTIPGGPLKRTSLEIEDEEQSLKLQKKI
ncbi:hypothetical protein ACWNT8_06110 [Pigmentibacter ruber]